MFMHMPGPKCVFQNSPGFFLASRTCPYSPWCASQMFEHFAVVWLSLRPFFVPKIWIFTSIQRCFQWNFAGQVNRISWGISWDSFACVTCFGLQVSVRTCYSLTMILSAANFWGSNMIWVAPVIPADERHWRVFEIFEISGWGWTTMTKSWSNGKFMGIENDIRGYLT